MTRPHPRFRLGRFVCFVVLLLAACARGGSPAAVVEGTEITDDRVRARVSMLGFFSELNGAPCGQPTPGETPGRACARFALANLVTDELVAAYALQHDIGVTDADVDAILDPFVDQVGAQEVGRRLEERGLALADLRALARRTLLLTEVREAIAAEALTDEVLRQEYAAREGEFTLLTASHILVETQREAEDIAARVTRGNFEDLAARYSTDESSAERGGDLGQFAPGDLDPAFAEAALALRPGEISGPVQTAFGWHVIYLGALDVVPFTDARGDLVARLSGRAFSEWIGEQLEGGGVRVNPRYGRLDPETGEIVPITSTATDAPARTPAAP